MPNPGNDLHLYPPWMPLAIARGNIRGVSHENIFGHNPVIDTNTDPEDIWDKGGVWVEPTAPRIHQIVSTSSDDDGAPLGDGAQTVLIEGLDANFLPQEETIILNGQTNVPTASTYCMIHRMTVKSAGSGGGNAGIITATADTDSTVTAQINVGNNVTGMCIYQIPAGKTGYLVHFWAALDEGGGGTGHADAEIQDKEFGEVWRVHNFFGLVTTGTSHFNQRDHVYERFESKTIIKIHIVEVTASGTSISGGLEFILVDD